jgi:hypothetical protein
MPRTLWPGALMTAYLALFLAVGPWPAASGVPATAHALARDASLTGVAIAAFLSWRVTRGSAFARGLMLLWTAVGFAGAFASPAMQSGSLVPCWLVAGYAGQLALLLSTPVYDRTRKDPAVRYPSPVSLWPAPRRWILPGALATALVCMPLGLGSMDLALVPGCESVSSPAASCMTISQGFPVHFLSSAQGVSLDGGFRMFLSDVAGAAYSAGALAEDLALWTLAALALIYLLWIPRRRPDPARPVTILAAPDSLAGH